MIAQLATDFGYELMTLQSVEAALRRLPRDDSAETIEYNLEFVRRLGQPSRIVPLLRLLMNSPMLAQVAARSYRHVNHFDKIVLVDSDDPSQYRLTLHLWAPPYSADQLEEELIHDHRFSFWSTILTGALVSQNYSVSENGKRFRQYRYIPEDRDALNFYRFVGERTLSAREVVRGAVGEAYFLSHEKVHRVLLPRSRTVCTLVLRGPRQSNHSNVYNTVYPEENIEMTPVMHSKEQLQEKLSHLLRVMARPAS